MKVLILQSELGVLRGGGENFTRNLFTSFAQRGNHVTAAFVADRKKCYPYPLPSNIEAMPIPGWWSRNFGQATLAAAGRYIRANGYLKTQWDWIQPRIHGRTIRWHNRRFKRRVELEFANRWGEFDAVYVHSDPLLAKDVARHRPTILRLPGPVGADFAPDLRAIHAVCANGDALVRIRMFLGDHATELPIGIDTELFSPGATSVRAALGWADQDRVVGYVGQLTHLKGVDLLATAFRDVSLAAPLTRLLIVGSGAEARYLRSILSKELDRGIVYIEPDVPHEQLPNWYRAMDLMVLPSRYENFSNALLEAMACGIPFLASDVGGNRQLAASGGGWLFETESVASLVSYLGKILENALEMRTRGEFGTRHVRNCHGWARTAAQPENVIQTQLGIPA